MTATLERKLQSSLEAEEHEYRRLMLICATGEGEEVTLDDLRAAGAAIGRSGKGTHADMRACKIRVDLCADLATKPEEARRGRAEVSEQIKQIRAERGRLVAEYNAILSRIGELDVRESQVLMQGRRIADPEIVERHLRQALLTSAAPGCTDPYAPENFRFGDVD